MSNGNPPPASAATAERELLKSDLKVHYDAAILIGEIGGNDVEYIIDLAADVALIHQRTAVAAATAKERQAKEALQTQLDEAIASAAESMKRDEMTIALLKGNLFDEGQNFSNLVKDYEELGDTLTVTREEREKAEAARELAEGENARLKAKLHAIDLAVDGYVDGAPDCNAVSKLANEVSLIIHPPEYP